MPVSTPALLQTIYVAYREKRLADVLALLDDDFRFTIHLPAEALPGAATPHGKAATATLLESLIEETKPALPPECRHLHYLLATPFRYGSYPRGSRFRRAGASVRRAPISGR